MRERFDADEDDDFEIVPVPLNGVTRRRLVDYAKAVGREPLEAAELLLRELLHDDELYNATSLPKPGRLHS